VSHPSNDSRTGRHWRRQLPASLPMAALVAVAVLLMLLAVFCIDLIASARAFVGGESAWSKGQKGATLALVQYSQTRDPAQWALYLERVAVPLGDRTAREALDQPQFDVETVRRGFLQGGNHADDIDGMVQLYRRFRHVPIMARAIDIWAQADVLVVELQSEAEALHAAVQRGEADPALAERRARLLALEARFTPLQERFSSTLGEAARTTQALLTALVAAATLALTLLGAAVMRHSARHDRHQAQALRNSEARRERTLRGSSDGFWEWDLQRRTAYVSPRFEELLGHAPGQLDPDVLQVQALQHPDDRAATRAALKRHLDHGEPYDVTLRMRHRDGQWRWMRSRAQSDRGPAGTELRLSGSISDITEQLQAEQALQRREAMFRSLWETTSDAVLIVDTRHIIRFANPAAHATFGHAAGSLQDQPLKMLQPARLQAAHVAGADRYVHTGRRHVDWRGTELVALHADGHEMPMEICFSTLELDGQHHFVGFMRDITHRKQAERALHDANEQLEARVAERTQALTRANERLRELDRLKSEFLATMSHELRTPLNSILGFTGLLQRGMTGPMTAEQLRQIGFVHESGRHLLALINDVLDLSRIESGRMEVAAQPFAFGTVAAEALEQLRPLADGKGLRLEADIAAGDIALVGDRRKLYQVLLNLLGNAVKFTRQGEVRLSARAEGERLHVSVQDTGIGMAAHQLGLLFQAFRQLDGSFGRHHEGTGLGLHLCRKLLMLMDGEIRACSTLGEGSTFHFSLPLVLQPSAQLAEAETAAVSAAEPGPGAGTRA